ncbi:MAG: FecR family protein [Burkholderiales bacterium]
MTNLFKLTGIAIVLIGLVLSAINPVFADDSIGIIKVSKGSVQIKRGDQLQPGPVGAKILQSDTLVTGADGSAGITFIDNTLLSAGPNSVIVIDRFAFDSTTYNGEFVTSVKSGTLSVVSGKIAKQSHTAMKVKTPTAILGVRGTEFLVRVED